ncbi:hypothetical protein L1987_04351 [Smallanthus sonchifolius]|uniref:Uncharacterized protein n=1 Tax=Smallanthus sonchifolius TaxID=185202 RepID=A0ACB9KD68_9ASTR|nr:hypothetical protein L1987_04351 [Smallanthus sonchifolius]
MGLISSRSPNLQNFQSISSTTTSTIIPCRGVCHCGWRIWCGWLSVVGLFLASLLLMRSPVHFVPAISARSMLVRFQFATVFSFVQGCDDFSFFSSRY